MEGESEEEAVSSGGTLDYLGHSFWSRFRQDVDGCQLDRSVSLRDLEWILRRRRTNVRRRKIYMLRG